MSTPHLVVRGTQVYMLSRRINWIDGKICRRSNPTFLYWCKASSKIWITRASCACINVSCNCLVFTSCITITSKERIKILTTILTNCCSTCGLRWLLLCFDSLFKTMSTGDQQLSHNEQDDLYDGWITKDDDCWMRSNRKILVDYLYSWNGKRSKQWGSARRSL